MTDDVHLPLAAGKKIGVPWIISSTHFIRVSSPIPFSLQPLASSTSCPQLPIGFRNPKRAIWGKREGLPFIYIVITLAGAPGGVGKLLGGELLLKTIWQPFFLHHVPGVVAKPGIKSQSPQSQTTEQARNFCHASEATEDAGKHISRTMSAHRRTGLTLRCQPTSMRLSNSTSQGLLITGNEAGSSVVLVGHRHWSLDCFYWGPGCLYPVKNQ